jgi:hypothetical protein
LYFAAPSAELHIRPFSKGSAFEQPAALSARSAANGTIDLSDMMELIRRDWIEPGKARITLRSSSGQIYTVATAMLVQSVNMAVELINTNVFRVLTDVTASERVDSRGNHRQGRERELHRRHCWRSVHPIAMPDTQLAGSWPSRSTTASTSANFDVASREGSAPPTCLPGKVVSGDGDAATSATKRSRRDVSLLLVIDQQEAFYEQPTHTRESTSAGRRHGEVISRPTAVRPGSEEIAA